MQNMGMGRKNLVDSLKDSDIWKLYKELVSETSINGLYNIEQFNKLEYGKLWRKHNLYPKTAKLKELLRKFYNTNIRPKMYKYELLK